MIFQVLTKSEISTGGWDQSVMTPLEYMTLNLKDFQGIMIEDLYIHKQALFQTNPGFQNPGISILSGGKGLLKSTNICYISVFYF